MDLVIVVGVTGGLLAVVYWFGRWILSPIDRAAKARRAPIRFSISDFLCLFVAVQLPLTLVSRLQSEETVVYFWIFTILAWVIAPIIWTACAIALSRAGITSGKHRLVFMGLILPIVYYGLTPFVVMAGMAVVTIALGDLTEILTRWWLLVVWFLTGAALVACGIYTNWLTENAIIGQPAAADDMKPPLKQ